MDGADDHKLYVMDANGKNAHLLIDQPVYGFAIANDVIYFSDGNMEDGASMPKLSLESVKLDGSDRETLVGDKTVGLITAQPGKIYFTSYDDESLHIYDTESKQTETCPVDEFNMCNIADGYISYLSVAGEMVLVAPDGNKTNMGQLDISGSAAE